MIEELQKQQTRLIHKAWEDETFKQQLKNDPKAAIQQELGITIPAEISVKLLEQDTNSYMIVVPQKPITEQELELVKNQFGEGETFQISQLLARAQQEATFKQELLNSPKVAISEALGKDIEEDVNIAVVEEQPQTAYIYLPAKPEGEVPELSEEDLDQVVGGVVIPVYDSPLNYMSDAIKAAQLGGEAVVEIKRKKFHA